MDSGSRVFSPVESLLDQFLSRHAIAGKVQHAQVLNEWATVADRVLTARVARYTKAIQWKQGELLVLCSNPPVANVVQSKSTYLLNQINAGFDKPMIKKIRTKIGIGS